MKTPHIKCIPRWPLRFGLLLIPLGLVCFTLSPVARAVDPPPDGGYPNQNTAEGDDALLNLTSGTDNAAMGFNALLSETTGSSNTAVGSQALANHTTFGSNVAIGTQALFSSQSGSANVAIGVQALYENISGFANVAIGALALNANTASSNTAIGDLAARFNTSGDSNTAVGASALYASFGSGNCAFGAGAMGANTTNSGSNNTAIGTAALSSNFGSNNTAIGFFAGGDVEAGDNNIFIGVNAGANVVGGNNNIEIGAAGKHSDQGDIRIGTKGLHNAVHIAGVYGRTVFQGVAVVTDSQGHLGTVTSSARYKDAIKPMDKASEAILALKPVTFRYKHELDPSGIPQFGLVAEDVEKVNPDLVARDEKGKPYTVRYEAVNAMLLNEFLKEHRRVAEQEATITELKAELRATALRQQKQIDALTASLQKVNAQPAVASPSHGELEASKRVSQTVVLNNR
ncbi:MAG TPA: tail fiber domain-containing protein [Candidatus Udaeobacter sp.]